MQRSYIYNFAYLLKYNLKQLFLHIGCKYLIVKDKMIISDGYNGSPTGFDNCCEDEDGKTKWHVLHAEANAILKVASSTQSCQGATLYLILSPCKECSKLVLQAGIRRLVYAIAYKDTAGIDFLKTANIEILELSLNE